MFLNEHDEKIILEGVTTLNVLEVTERLKLYKDKSPEPLTAWDKWWVRNGYGIMNSAHVTLVFYALIAFFIDNESAVLIIGCILLGAALLPLFPTTRANSKWREVKRWRKDSRKTLVYEPQQALQDVYDFVHEEMKKRRKTLEEQRRQIQMDEDALEVLEQNLNKSMIMNRHE